MTADFLVKNTSDLIREAEDYSLLSADFSNGTGYLLEHSAFVALLSSMKDVSFTVNKYVSIR